MIVFHSGFRETEYATLGKLPPNVLWTFFGMKPYHGGRGVKGLWRRAVTARKRPATPGTAAPRCVAPQPRPGPKESLKTAEGRLIIFFSGEENRAVPEVVLGDKANLMLTYMEIKINPPRWRRLVKAREKR